MTIPRTVAQEANDWLEKSIRWERATMEPCWLAVKCGEGERSGPEPGSYTKSLKLANTG